MPWYRTLGVRYAAEEGCGRITAALDLESRSRPDFVLVRFRHPDRLPLRAVRVNGAPWTDFAPQLNDVTLTGHTGRVVVEAEF